MNEDIIKETAKRLGMSPDLVEKVIKAYMNFIRFRISKIKYKELDSFDKVKTNFSLPGLGKLVVKNRVNRRFKNDKTNGETESKTAV